MCALEVSQTVHAHARRAARRELAGRTRTHRLAPKTYAKPHGGQTPAPLSGPQPPRPAPAQKASGTTLLELGDIVNSVQMGRQVIEHLTGMLSQHRDFEWTLFTTSIALSRREVAEKLAQLHSPERDLLELCTTVRQGKLGRRVSLSAGCAAGVTHPVLRPGAWVHACSGHADVRVDDHGRLMSSS
jgi:hypothetical protein